jgi:mannose-6-phosphate isomerase-like protein (cupin superfamily)
MGEIKVIRSDEVKAQPYSGLREKEGQVKRIIRTKRMFISLSEVNPGFSPHPWHTHTSNKTEGYSIDYAEDFEEIYLILNGSGVIQWKTESGEIRAEEVGPGDTIHMPPGADEHQLLNKGPEKMRLIIFGSPPSQVTYTK